MAIRMQFFSVSPCGSTQSQNLLGWIPSCVSFGLVAKDGGRSSTVELRIVVPAVAGSNPVGHPSDLRTPFYSSSV